MTLCKRQRNPSFSNGFFTFLIIMSATYLASVLQIRSSITNRIFVSGKPIIQAFQVSLRHKQLCTGSHQTTSISYSLGHKAADVCLPNKYTSNKSSSALFSTSSSSSLSSFSSSSDSMQDKMLPTNDNNEEETDDNEAKEDEEIFSNYITTKNKADTFHNQIEVENDSIEYPKGMPEGFYIIKHHNIPDRQTVDTMLQRATEDNNNLDDKIDHDEEGSNSSGKSGVTKEALTRLGILNGSNMTLPIALMLIDPVGYPSFSKARKACRKGYIIIHRGPLDKPDDNDKTEIKNEFNLTKCIRGRVGDRIYPNDVIGIQVRMHGGFYPGLESNKPPFELPVVYEDDHFAIVNKPAGIVVYSQKNQGYGMMTVRSALPFFLKPPKRGTLAIIRRPGKVCGHFNCIFFSFLYHFSKTA